MVNGFNREAVWGQPYRYQGLVTFWGYFLFFFLFSQAEGISLREELMKKAIFFGGVTVALLVIFQGIALKVFRWPIYHYNGRLAGFLGNPNFAAGFLSLSFVYGCFGSYRQRFLKLAWPIFLLALWFTGSRSGLIVFLFVAILLILIDLRKKALAVIVLGLAGLTFLLLFPSRPVSPFENRLVIWKKAVVAFTKKPLLGWGLENFESAFRFTLRPEEFDLKNIRVDKAHNEFLEILVAGGLLGLGAYLLLLKEAISTLWKRRENLWAKTNLMTLVAYLILSQLNVLNISEYLFFYFVLANAAVLV